MMNPVKEVWKDLKKERLYKRVNESMTRSKPVMTQIMKDNKETEIDLQRISRLEDPIEQYKKNKENNKIQYEKLMGRLSQTTLGSGPLGALRSPSRQGHSNIFTRSK